MSLLAQKNIDSPGHNRRYLIDESPEILTGIYEEDVNIVTWRRPLSEAVGESASQLLSRHARLQRSLTLSPKNTRESLLDEFGSDELLALIEDMANLVDMFCCLFGLRRAGFRLTALDSAMCPRFHVDHVPCRLVTTYCGVATEWLPHHGVDRSKLGAGSQGVSDEKSGLFEDSSVIQRLHSGDVALLKGERWLGNEGAGLVHRSPQLGKSERRLLLTLDFSDA